MKHHTEGIDSHTGEYFYRENRKPKPQPQFHLNFDSPVSQIGKLVSPEWMERILQMIHHKERLRELGCLPDNWQRKLETQITRKAESAMAKFRKEQPRVELIDVEKLHAERYP